MDPVTVKECLKNLKVKNSEGSDRIPQRILADGVEILCEPISNLMEMIYLQKTISDQWLKQNRYTKIKVVPETLKTTGPLRIHA
jgi:hypothetical protein